MATMVLLISNPFTQLLYMVLVYLNGLAERLPLPASVSSYAIAIIVVAVLIKILIQPLMSQQQTSMRRMQELQPKIAELQKRYKDDREKLSKAQLELYQEHGVNPAGGCLPLIIQMVVLFGMWRAVMNLAGTAAEPGPLVGQPFVWVPDLAKCEPSPLCGQEMSLLPVAVPILLVLMTVSQLAYQRLLTPPSQSTDPQQQAMASMMKFMPLMFAYIFISLPAGLLLYYTTFNIVGLVQQGLPGRLKGLTAMAPAAETSGPDVAEAPLEQPVGPEKKGTTREGEPRERRRRRKKVR